MEVGAMLLNPPGPLPADLLPHWPYARALDQALTGRGIPPGAVRVERAYGAPETAVLLVLGWDASRCAGQGGIRLGWSDDSGWSHALIRPVGSAVSRGPLAALRRVFAAPEAVADVAHALVTGGFGDYARQWHEQWDGARDVREGIGAFRQAVGQRTAPKSSDGRSAPALRCAYE
ncbi:hypothetical protein J8N05_46765 (plasmid) [Streptomyces sp. BH-SS-21]|uniref:Uncharacterized protein n=1 Tax=Streptomyces liliiviolaceus TaxID=2823109 RepID=A0A940Y5M7_9ACTN|nr:DUF6292 family protein [Streptomyces liliiviolaceus]MBQ0855665.1 hypothetical protein [Streptomyces liliiviolaceus]